MSKNKLHHPDSPNKNKVVIDVYLYPIRQRPKPRLAVPLSEHLKAVEEHRRNVEAVHQAEAELLREGVDPYRRPLRPGEDRRPKGRD
jgi:hypothetical protein